MSRKQHAQFYLLNETCFALAGVHLLASCLGELERANQKITCSLRQRPNLAVHIAALLDEKNENCLRHFLSCYDDFDRNGDEQINALRNEVLLESFVLKASL